MRCVVQRVLAASVTIDKVVKSTIGKGLLVLVGFEDEDTKEDVDWMSAKLVNMRLFDDESGVPNICLLDDGGEILLVSQFTLHASTKKGNRPSYMKAAKPNIALPLYNLMVNELDRMMCKMTKTGEFGANMQVSLVNDGPITIFVDSKNKE